MKKKTIVSMVLWVFGVSMVSAQSPYPEQRPLDLRVTGAFLSTDQQKRDDIVTIDVSVQGKPMLLRIGKVEDLTTQERAHSERRGVVKESTFYGPGRIDGAASEARNGWESSYARRMA